jgi:eukaryotic-like serine/threonine-protein kinase
MNPTAMNPTEAIERHPFEELADEFVLKFRSGHSPSIEHYAQAYPEHAAMIRSIFPSLMIVEKVSAKVTNESIAPTLSATGSDPTQLVPKAFDDFEILQCIGRGGMGVVYEAIQGSLQRRVALKVIHAQASASPRSRERFRREAESAAGLHHTNIVPVYGSGEDHGLQYYAMQLIHGSTLADIIVSLRARLVQSFPHEPLGPALTLDAVDQLLTQRAASPSAKYPQSSQKGAHKSSNSYSTPSKPSQDDQPTSPLAPNDPTLPAETRDLTRAAIQEPMQGSPLATDELSTSILPASILPASILPGTSEVSPDDRTVRAIPMHYYRNIARLTSKVADALDYAHQSGVLHRDIKPSNLLLDQTGTIWVADFGLAFREDLEGQTQTGELLGTLRYMAPEQFVAKADSRSDIYSLGLTLFELLTLRPALEAPKRRVLDPTKYSQLEFTASERQVIPRDLQTIVLKASALEPVNRYERAKDFQEDLERFLDDLPILARRESPIESAMRWIRRNPAIASLTASLFGLLVAIATILGLWNRQQRETLDELKLAYIASANSLADRTKALEQANTESQRARQNMDLALEAFSTITENIASRGRSLEIQGLDEAGLETDGFADAVLTQADVELLKSLQNFFDRFAEENATDLSFDAAISRRRVGEIENKIGRYDQAAQSLRRAIAEFEAVRNKDQGGQDKQRVLNEEVQARKELIGLHSRRDQFPRAIEEMENLREVLAKNPEFATSEEGRFGLVSALESLSSGSARLALDRSLNDRNLNDRRRRLFPPFYSRPGPWVPEIPIPMAQRLERDLAYNAQAIELLDGLSQQYPVQSKYRLGLARNHRDRMRMYRLLGLPSEFEKSLGKASEIFQDLLSKNPTSAVLKYELANLYATSLVHPSVDGNRLEEAIRLVQESLQEHPGVPEYQTLYASLLARSAWTIPAGIDPAAERQFERVENGVIKLQQSIAIHQGLVDRFPEIQVYAIHLLQTKMQIVDYYNQFRRPERAKQTLAEAIALAEKLIESGTARQPALRAILDRLKERKNTMETKPELEKP